MNQQYYPLVSAILDASSDYARGMFWGECTVDAIPIERRTRAAQEALRRHANNVWRLEIKAARARSRKAARLAELKAEIDLLVGAAETIVASGWQGEGPLAVATERLAYAAR